MLNPFSKRETVQHKLKRTKPTENQKLSPKFDRPWKIMKLVKSTHDLNVNLVYINNPNVTMNIHQKVKKSVLYTQSAYGISRSQFSWLNSHNFESV